MQTQPNRERTMIPASQLRRSPLNARKTASTVGIEELAAMIAAQGVLQNLAVVAMPTKGKQPAYGVVAGGRRLAALQHLIKEKTIPATYPVPCLVVDNEEAVELSIAENSGREDMHPADQFEAFRALIDAGRSIEDVAARFGLAPVTVQRRLKLANVAPRFLAMYREEDMDTDTLMALALVDDHAKQEAVWDGLQSWQQHASAIRSILMDGKVSGTATLARFVGVKAYEKAGGAVERDLFSDASVCYLADVALLHQLAAAKLTKAAEQVKAEGFAWVDVCESMDYSERSALGRVGTRLRDATAKEQAQMDALQAESTVLESEQGAIDGEQGADPENERWDAICERLGEIEAVLEGIEEARSEVDPEQQAKAGAVVTIDHAGKLEIIRNVLRPADAKAFQRTERDRHASTGGTEDFGEGYSEALLRRLDAHRTRALQVELMRRPDTALQALVQSLVVSKFYDEPWSGMASVRGNTTSLRDFAPDLPESAAEQAAQAIESKWRDTLPSEAEQLWAWIQRQPQTTLLELLAYCVAETVNASRNRAGVSNTDALAHAVALDMHDWWKPTAAAYFQSLPKPRILACLAEIDPKADAGAAGKMKKKDLASFAASRAEACGWTWLPEPMRSNAA